MCDVCCSRTIIGQGGYGYIYEDSNDENVVVKCQPASSDAPFRELIAYHYLDHPNIPKIWDVEFVKGSLGDYVHFKMKRYTPLKEYMEDEMLDMDTKKKIFLDILSAVSYLQSRSLYHQDVRVDNVLIDTDTQPITAYLSDFGFANDTYVVQAGWVDYVINEYYYTHCKTPSLEMMLDGDCWSLGLFGVYLFCDIDIYHDLQKFKYDCLDGTYYQKGRFGFGLKNALLNLKIVPENIAAILEALMDERVSITDGHKHDPIDFETFNGLDQKDQLEYVKRLYRYNITEIDSVAENVNRFIAVMKSKPMNSRNEALNAMRETLDKIGMTNGKENKIKLVYLLYGGLIPQTYEYFAMDTSFWSTVIKKLKELNTDPDVDLSDLIERHMEKFEEMASKSQTSVSEPVCSAKSKRSDVCCRRKDITDSRTDRTSRTDNKGSKEVCKTHESTEKTRQIDAVKTEDPDKFVTVPDGFVVQPQDDGEIKVVGIRDEGNIRELTEDEKGAARALGLPNIT